VFSSKYELRPKKQVTPPNTCKVLDREHFVIYEISIEKNVISPMTIEIQEVRYIGVYDKRTSYKRRPGGR
jgi:hypothetical protein